MSFIAGAATCFSWLAAVLMLFQVSLDILGKFLFGTPVPGTAEVVASYYMIALVFMALPLIEKRQDAIVVDLLYERFGPRLQRVCRIAALVFTLVFYLAFAWITFGIAMKSMAIREVIIGSRCLLYTSDAAASSLSGRVGSFCPRAVCWRQWW